MNVGQSQHGAAHVMQAGVWCVLAVLCVCLQLRVAVQLLWLLCAWRAACPGASLVCSYCVPGVKCCGLDVYGGEHAVHVAPLTCVSPTQTGPCMT
jgi:hypothetical protein